MPSLSDDQARLFLDPNFGNLATLRADGSPHVTPVWIDYDGEHIVFNTAVGRVKHRNLKNDPRLAIEVLAHDNPYKYVSVTGTVEEMVEGEEAESHIDKLAQKYLGQETYPSRQPGERRVLVRVRPDLIDGGF